MSDFVRYCPKCYTFFRDLDLYTKHVESCGFAKKTTGKTADSRRQTAAEKKRDSKQKTTDSNKEDVDNTLASAAVCGLPSAVPTEGGTPSAVSQKSPKFKT